uniref:DUF4283 domain-containing protein n=1 Tax=Lactuca sativa TaxID=4236 RepID=A0A9R1WQ50_LACSA|nr:hypothetical protein LSAT_V11C100000080 [Lactuca sativa]
MKTGDMKSKANLSSPKISPDNLKVNEPVSYADKVSGKRLNAANLISKVKKNAELPVGVVEMPLSDILIGCSPFKTTLYGYFIDKHVNFFNVNKFAHNIWKKHGLEELMVNDEGIYFFRFSTEQGMLSVLEGGVWMVFDSALVVRIWTTGVSSVKDQHDKVPVWVKIFNVPLEYWNGTGLSHIAWEIAKPLDVDAHMDKMCQEHWGRPAFMRILIEMSAATEWLKEVQVYSSDLTSGERIISKCKIEYAWNPSKCSHCKVYGHKDSTCGILLAKEVKNIESPISYEKIEDGIKVDLMEVLIASTKKVEEDSEGFQKVVNRNKGNNMGGKKIEESGSKSQISIQGQNGKTQENGKKWGGNIAGTQGQKGNNYTKNGSNNGGNQWNKGKGIQGYNGKNRLANGINKDVKMEQGENSKNATFSKKENVAGAVSMEKSNQGNLPVNRVVPELKQEEVLGKKLVSGQKYIPKSGPYIKISSNFDKKVHSEKFREPVIPFSNNKFDVLNYLEDENQFVFKKGGIPEVDLDYLDNVDQMEVIGGIPLSFPMTLSFGIWNVRGLNQSPKQKEIKNLIKGNNLSLLAILESQVSFNKLNEKCEKIFGSWKWIANKGNLGHTFRIILGWNSNLFDVNLIDHNDQVIHCKVNLPSNNKYVFCSIVYAANKYIDRRGLWSSLVHHKGFVRDDSWIIGGDFNVTISPNESSAGSSKFTKGMVEFIDCINFLEIQDINSNGLNLTWNQKPQGDNAQKSQEAYSQTFKGTGAFFGKC